MTTSRMNELVAGLTGVHDHQVAGPATPGARELLTAITAERRPAPTTARRHGRFAAGVVAATAVATAAVALSAGGPGPVRGYANAAVDIRRTDGTYRVHIKNVYADQRQFHAAFAKFGLDVSLSIVPVAPGREREIVGGGGDATGTVATVLNCPPRQRTACPLTVELSGTGIRQGATEIMIGRTARPGEAYWGQRSGAGDHPPSLRLTGRTVTGALASLHQRNLTAVYVLGRFHKDGSGFSYSPPPTWRPGGERRVTGAWMHSSDSVTLLLAPGGNDPDPDPKSTEYPR